MSDVSSDSWPHSHRKAPDPSGARRTRTNARGSAAGETGHTGVDALARPALLATVPLVAALALAASAGATSQAVPSLRFFDLTPVKVRGAHFVPGRAGEADAARGDGDAHPHGALGRAGGFTVSFGMPARAGPLQRLRRGDGRRRPRRPRLLQASRDGLPVDDRGLEPLEERRGAARRRPLEVHDASATYGVTVSVSTSCVLPVVTLEVMVAIDL